MRRFVVATEGRDKLNLRRVCEDFANDVWVPAHLSPKQAAQFVLDHFKEPSKGTWSCSASLASTRKPISECNRTCPA